MNEKTLLASKAFWLGLITFALALADFVQGAEFVQQWPQVVTIIGMGVGVLTVIVRILTTKPITIGKPK